MFPGWAFGKELAMTVAEVPFIAIVITKMRLRKPKGCRFISCTAELKQFTPETALEQLSVARVRDITVMRGRNCRRRAQPKRGVKSAKNLSKRLTAADKNP